MANSELLHRFIYISGLTLEQRCKNELGATSKKAFKSALGIQKSHKRSNPASVQLADEAAQRYF